MTEQGQGYLCTTDSNNYKEWPWYQEYRQLERPGAAVRMGGGQVPVDVAIEFSQWIMKTPEIRDIVFRRFVQGDYDNETEKMLLSFAQRYFLLKSGQAGSPELISIAWGLIAKVLIGTIECVESSEFREKLSSYTFAIAPTSNSSKRNS